MKNREREIVFGVGEKILPGNFFPLCAIKCGEEDIGARIGVDFRVVHALGKPKRMFKNLGTADDEELGLAGGLRKLDAGVQRGDDLGIRRLEIREMREDDEVAAWHEPF